MAKSSQNKTPPKAAKSGSGKSAKKPVAATAANTTTLGKVKKIVKSYGIVANPVASTVVGPAVTSMAKFTMDVNNTCNRNYVVGLLQASWTISQTSNYIDNNP
jgi:hypothetical protein